MWNLYNVKKLKTPKRDIGVGVFIINFEQNSHSFLVFSLLALGKSVPVRSENIGVSWSYLLNVLWSTHVISSQISIEDYQHIRSGYFSDMDELAAAEKCTHGNFVFVYCKFVALNKLFAFCPFLFFYSWLFLWLFDLFTCLFPAHFYSTLYLYFSILHVS